MKPGKARSLIFFVLLFAVAALALDASYAQGLGSGSQHKAQGRPMDLPGFGGRIMMQPACELGNGETILDP